MNSRDAQGTVEGAAPEPAVEPRGRVPFRRWMPNYKFGYICAWVAIIASAVLLVRNIFSPVADPVGGVLMGLVLLVSLFLVWKMPAWALDAGEETERRRRAGEAREELRRR